MQIYTVSQKNDTAFACYYFDVHQPILINLGRNVANKVSSQTVLYFPPHLTSASALSGETRQHEDRIFSLKCSIIVFSEFNQSVLDFFNFVDL